jgi:hypothetical protein
MKALYYITLPVTLTLYTGVLIANKLVERRSREQFLDDWRKANKYVDEYNQGIRNPRSRLKIVK